MTAPSWKSLKAALARRPAVSLLCLGCLVSLALLLTPRAGRAWLVLAWSAAIYVGWALASAMSSTRPPRNIGAVRAPASAQSAPVLQGEALYKPTEEALRKLDDPAGLGECSLGDLLPCTLRQMSELEGGAARLNRQQVLRKVLEEAVGRLRPADGAEPGKQTLQYSILHDEYVLGRKTAHIMTRHSISEANLHLHRRNAIRAVARDLAEQEQALLNQHGL